MALIITPSLACANGSVTMFQLKAALKAQGWTVPRSSDGTTYNSSGDQITSGGSGAGGMANPSAWFVIQQPVSGRQFMMQRHTSVDYFWWIQFSTASGFTGGSPGATTPATAADAQNLCGTSTASTASLFSAGEAQRVSIGVDSAAPYGFYLTVNQQGTTTFRNLFFMDFMQAGTFDAADTEPYTVMFSSLNPVYSSVSNSGAAGVVQGVTPQNGNIWGWFKYGLSGAAWQSQPWLYWANASGQFYNAVGTNPFNGDDDLFPAPYGHFGTNGIFKGISSFFQFMGTQRASQDTLTLTTTRDYLVIGPGMAVPWDGSVPVL